MLDFFFNPSYNIIRNNSLKSKIKELFLVMFFLYISIVSVSIFIFIINLLVEERYSVSLMDIINKSQTEYIKSDYKNVLIVLIGAPVIEEIMFRLFLMPGKCYFTISFSLILFLLLNSTSLPLGIRIISTIIFGVLIFLFVEQQLIILLQRKFAWFLYGSAIMFGVLHISNFVKDVPPQLYIYTPFYILPPLIMGLFSSYLRIKNGLVYSVALHFFFNLPAAISSVNLH